MLRIPTLPIHSAKIFSFPFCIFGREFSNKKGFGRTGELILKAERAIFAACDDATESRILKRKVRRAILAHYDTDDDNNVPRKY